MSDKTDWLRTSQKIDPEDNPYGPLPDYFDAVLDGVGPAVVAGSRNRLRALGCVLVGAVAEFAEDRVTKVSVRDLKRFLVGNLGRAARLPGDDVQSLIFWCIYATDPPARKTEEELTKLITKYPDLEMEIRRDAEIVAEFLDDPVSGDEVWAKAKSVGRAEFADWWENPDVFSAKRLIKVISSAPADAPAEGG
jgi:hypothetical protein